MSQVAATTFAFDLQRFALASNTGHGYDYKEAQGYASATDGKYFQVSSDAQGKQNVRYFNNISAALNYIYCYDPSQTETAIQSATDKTGNKANESTTGNNKNPYYSDSTYTATIKVLQDVTEGAHIAFGGVIQDSSEVTLANAKKSNITIDLGGFNYNFAEPVVVALGKDKAITTKNYVEKTSDSTKLSKLTIKNGSLSVEAQPKSGKKFERIVKSYVDLEFDNVTIDATNLKGQAGGEDGAAICHTQGTLTLKGTTTVKVQPNTGEDIFYAVSGKLGNFSDTTQAASTSYGYCKIDVDLEDGGYIPNIGLYGWTSGNATNAGVNYRDYPTDFSATNLKLNVKKGEIGEITVDGVAVDGKGISSYSSNHPPEMPETISGNSSGSTWNRVSTITNYASTSNISLGNGISNSESLATLGLFDFKSGSNYLIYQKDTVRPYTYAIKGWNRANIGDDTELNYVAQSLTAGGTADPQGRGDWLINVKNVNDKADLVLDTSHKIFGIPTSATAALKTNSDGTYKGYKLAYLKYNSGKDAVTITSSADSVNANMYIAPKTAAAATDGILAESIKTIDASDISVAVSLIGNTLGNAIYDGKGDNYIQFASGDAASIGDTLIFGGGADSIANFHANDFIKLSRNIDPVTDASKVASLASDGFVLGFGTSDSIKLQGYNSAFTGDGKRFLTGVNVEASNGDNYVYTKQSIAYKAKNSSVYGSLTFTSAIADTISYDASNESTFYTIDAGAVQHSTSLTGEGNDNRLIGSATKGNRLYGKAGNDFLKGSTVTAEGDVFVYSDGNDTIEGFKATDKANVTSARLDGITEAKTHGDKLIFTVDKDNSLTFNNSATERISLETEGFLTQAGYVDKDNNAKFRLFAGTKGNINLNDSLYSSATISAVDASAITNSVTLTADSVLGSLNLAANQKKDSFIYGGGKVTISGYENGTDRLDISEVGPLNIFEVSGSDVAISVREGATDVISLRGAAAQEVLMRDAGQKGNSFSKFVFAKTGVLYNKEKKPTEATIYHNIKGNFAPDDNSVKKIFVTADVHDKRIQSGDNKATLDASAAKGVSLVGGTDNNKFIGSGDFADTFIYNGGKDMVNNFVSTGTGTADSIALGSSFSIEGAKITLSKKSIKFKFDNKNALTLKGDSAIESLTANGKNYFYAKNAYSIGGISQVSLTSQFSGTYKIAKDDAGKITAVDGSAVKKNLTFKGTTEKETFIGGQKKTTFKGGGGKDTLIGGTGKDIFFYAKGDKDTTTIANFDFGIDKLKIANGTIQTITHGNDGITFEMSSGKKGDTSTVGSFNVKSYSKDGTPTTLNADTANKVVFKANSTYYWFAQEDITDTEDGTSTTLAKTGDLITWADKKVTARDVADCSVIDLGYSTNLAKTGVAIKVASTATNASTLPSKIS